MLSAPADSLRRTVKLFLPLCLPGYLVNCSFWVNVVEKGLAHIIHKFDAIARDRVLERILLPIVEYLLIIKRQSPSEAPKAFGAEN